MPRASRRTRGSADEGLDPGGEGDAASHAGVHGAFPSGSRTRRRATPSAAGGTARHEHGTRTLPGELPAVRGASGVPSWHAAVPP